MWLGCRPDRARPSGHEQAWLGRWWGRSSDPGAPGCAGRYWHDHDGDQQQLQHGPMGMGESARAGSVVADDSRQYARLQSADHANARAGRRTGALPYLARNERAVRTLPFRWLHTVPMQNFSSATMRSTRIAVIVRRWASSTNWMAMYSCWASIIGITPRCTMPSSTRITRAKAT